VSRDPVAGVFVTTVSVISLLSYFCILAARAMETRVLLVDISASMGAVDLNIAKTALMSLVQQKMIQVSPHRLLLRCAKNWARGQVQRKSSSELNYARCRRSERSCAWCLSHYVSCGRYSHLSATCVPHFAPACDKFAGCERCSIVQMPTKTKMGLVMMGSNGEHDWFFFRTVAFFFLRV